MCMLLEQSLLFAFLGALCCHNIIKQSYATVHAI